MKLAFFPLIGLTILLTGNIFGQSSPPADTVANLIIIPTVFNPVPEGGNSLYQLRPINSQAVKAVKFQIYNRWGEMVFETDELTHAWDGKYNDKMLPDGVYVYAITVEFYDLVNHEQTKTVDRKGLITKTQKQ
jgi:gliding motility-associated-like protein